MLSGDDFAAVLKSRERRRSVHFSLHWRTATAALPVAAALVEASLAGALAVLPASIAPVSRLGLVLPKKIARTSVRRNLIKRQSRALFRIWSTSSTVVCDVVLKLGANVAKLDRRAQYGELAGLMQALPRV